LPAPSGAALRAKAPPFGYLAPLGSRDSRPDCKQVCIGPVCTPEGQPLSYEVFAGNRTDVTTVEEIVHTMEEKYGQAQRVWVMDRGMVSEKNSGFLRERGARHLVGTPNRLGPRHGPLTELLPSIYFAHRCPHSIPHDFSRPCASSR